MTINVDLIQSFIPDFASDYSYETEVKIKVLTRNNQVEFAEEE